MSNRTLPVTPSGRNHQLEAGTECGLEGMGRIYDYRISRNRADPKMSESRMLYTRCKTTCGHFSEAVAENVHRASQDEWKCRL